MAGPNRALSCDATEYRSDDPRDRLWHSRPAPCAHRARPIAQPSSSHAQCCLRHITSAPRRSLFERRKHLELPSACDTQSPAPRWSLPVADRLSWSNSYSTDPTERSDPFPFSAGSDRTSHCGYSESASVDQNPSTLRRQRHKCPGTSAAKRPNSKAAVLLWLEPPDTEPRSWAGSCSPFQSVSNPRSHGRAIGNIRPAI